MSASTFLNNIADCSYSSKVTDCGVAFKVVKSYLTNYESSSVAYDMTMYICLSMFAADSSLSGKEANFFNEFLGQRFEFGYLADEYRSFRAKGYSKVFSYLEDAPLDIRKQCAIMGACCLSCDRVITSTEVEDFEGLLRLLNLRV